MLVDDLAGIALFDGLSREQLAELADAGSEVRAEPGTEAWQEGEPADMWWVLLDGAITLRRRIGREVVVVGQMDTPGRWAGGFRAWDPGGAYLATGSVRLTSRLFSLPAEHLRSLSTSWFPFGAHLIQGLYGTARTVESFARQRDALVTLGTLSAGLAHELNNPAAAATRAASALEDVQRDQLSTLTRLAQGEIAPAQLVALGELRDELVPSATRDPLALADLEEALADWLEERGVDRSWVVAPVLAAAGADVAWLDRLAAVIDGAALGPAVDWVSGVASMQALLAEVRESTGRVSALVAAVRSYSQMDRGSFQEVDVTEGIESTLVMLGHKLRGGVTVQRRYGTSVPRIEAYAGELNQVWTNLIDNAVDAMDGQGTLTLTTAAADPDHVVVEVADTGPGMPPDVAARAFDAFYTTKELGKGTGLGLDIARRIVVERHAGVIDIDSGPGHTTMRVQLPVRAG